MAPILMHGPEIHHPTGGRPAGRIWLLAGTGDGPPLAEALLRQGWHVTVSVVSEAATRPYRPHPSLQVKAGALAGEAAIRAELQRHPYAAVVDATHPFAVQISAALTGACRHAGQRLLRLQRSVPTGAGVVPLPSLTALGEQQLAGEHLLLAIGMRQLGAAVRLSPGAIHHARLLPSAEALQSAQAAGLAAERVACVRPSRSGWIEAGLLRHWGITTVLARQGGGFSEAVWQRLCAEQEVRLLLIERPRSDALPRQELLARLAALVELTGSA
jgi:precorrin-6A/cobalt-precorrin-6A reductase